jgi:uncharacterized protein YciI
MFIITLTYRVPIERIEELLEEHRAYLQKYYERGYFIMSGPRTPREGGIIFAQASSAQEMQIILEEDPFWREGAAAYEIREFTPTMFAKDVIIPAQKN